MELLTPGSFLVIWQLFYLMTILLALISWTLVLTAKIDPTKKLIWLLGTLFLPVIGPILLFFSLSKLKRVD